MARTVSEVDATPSNVYEVTVLLEALGFFRKDEAERSEFIKVTKRVQRLVPLYSAQSKKSLRKKSRSTIRRNLRAFTSGIAYSTMWSIMLMVLFAGGISLWATYPERLGSLSAGVAFSVGFGVLISFIATGGAQQVFSQRISYYRIQDNSPLARTEARRGYVIGFISIAIAALAFLFAMAATTVFPFELATYTLLFLALLGSYLVLVIPLYAHRKFHLIALGLITALACLYSVFYTINYSGLANANYDVVISQFVSLVALNAITVIECIMVVFRPRQRMENLRNPEFDNSTPSRNIRAAKFSIVLLEMVPLFVFGTMFYLLLFLDRLVGWTAMGAPFLLTYSTHYQFGADIALLVLIPLTGMIYYFSAGFYDLLETESSTTQIQNREHLKNIMKGFVTRMFASIGIVASASVFILWQYAPLAFKITDTETLLVFRLSLIAYSLLALLLANTFISLSFRRYLVPALLFIVAILTDIGVNLLSPRFILGWHHAYGLLVGLTLATVIATVSTTRLIKHAHYFYYSAF